MLNCIIQLQAVAEIITNATAKALNILAKQQTKIHIYQNHLTLDYFLALEGGVSGKFNLSNGCLRIDDEIIEEITNKMKKLAHVSVQTMKGWSPNVLFGGWALNSRWFQNLKRGNIPCLRSIADITLPDPPGIVVFQDHFGKKDSCSCNSTVEI
jgi:hypothetical protein